MIKHNIFSEVSQPASQCNLLLQDVAKSLQELLNYDGDVEEDFCLTFQASMGQNGRMITEDLVKGKTVIRTLLSNLTSCNSSVISW